MLCENFSLSKTEFDQIMSLPESEPLFNLLDDSGNGLVDYMELFTLLGVLAECRYEDKFRYLFELYDLNFRGYLEDVEVEFMTYNII